MKTQCAHRAAGRFSGWWKRAFAYTPSCEKVSADFPRGLEETSCSRSITKGSYRSRSTAAWLLGAGLWLGAALAAGETPAQTGLLSQHELAVQKTRELAALAEHYERLIDQNELRSKTDSPEYQHLMSRYDQSVKLIDQNYVREGLKPPEAGTRVTTMADHFANRQKMLEGKLHDPCLRGSATAQANAQLLGASAEAAGVMLPKANGSVAVDIGNGQGFDSAEHDQAFWETVEKVRRGMSLEEAGVYPPGCPPNGRQFLTLEFNKKMLSAMVGTEQRLQQKLPPDPAAQAKFLKYDNDNSVEFGNRWLEAQLARPPTPASPPTVSAVREAAHASAGSGAPRSPNDDLAQAQRLIAENERRLQALAGQPQQPHPGPAATGERAGLFDSHGKLQSQYAGNEAVLEALAAGRSEAQILNDLKSGRLGAQPGTSAPAAPAQVSGSGGSLHGSAVELKPVEGFEHPGLAVGRGSPSPDYLPVPVKPETTALAPYKPPQTALVPVKPATTALVPAQPPEPPKPFEGRSTFLPQDEPGPRVGVRQATWAEAPPGGSGGTRGGAASGPVSAKRQPPSTIYVAPDGTALTRRDQIMPVRERSILLPDASTPITSPANDGALAWGDDLKKLAGAYAQGEELSTEQMNVLRRNNDVINRMASQGELPNDVYQKVQTDFSKFNQTRASIAAHDAGLNLQQQKSTKTEYAPQTDSDYIHRDLNPKRPVDPRQINMARDNYNDRMNQELGTKDVDYAKKFDTDFMADPRGMTAEDFTKVAKLNNDAYTRRGAAEYEFNKRAGKPITEPQSQEYLREMQDMYNKKQGQAEHYGEEAVKAHAGDPEIMQPATKSLDAQLLQKAQLETKYTERVNQEADRLAKEVNPARQQRIAGKGLKVVDGPTPPAEATVPHDERLTALASDRGLSDTPAKAYQRRLQADKLQALQDKIDTRNRITGADASTPGADYTSPERRLQVDDPIIRQNIKNAATANTLDEHLMSRAQSGVAEVKAGLAQQNLDAMRLRGAAELGNQLSPSQQGELIDNVQLKYGPEAAQNLAAEMRAQKFSGRPAAPLLDGGKSSFAPEESSVFTRGASKVGGAVTTAREAVNNMERDANVAGEQWFNAMGGGSLPANASAARQALNTAGGHVFNAAGTAAGAYMVYEAGQDMYGIGKNIYQAMDQHTTDAEANRHFDEADALARKMALGGAAGVAMSAVPLVGQAAGVGLGSYAGTRYLLENTDTGKTIDRAVLNNMDSTLQAGERFSDALQGTPSQSQRDADQIRNIRKSYQAAMDRGDLLLKPGVTEDQLMDDIARNPDGRGRRDLVAGYAPTDRQADKDFIDNLSKQLPTGGSEAHVLQNLATDLQYGTDEQKLAARATLADIRSKVEGGDYDVAGMVRKQPSTPHEPDPYGDVAHTLNSLYSDANSKEKDKIEELFVKMSRTGPDSIKDEVDRIKADIASHPAQSGPASSTEPARPLTPGEEALKNQMTDALLNTALGIPEAKVPKPDEPPTDPNYDKKQGLQSYLNNLSNLGDDTRQKMDDLKNQIAQSHNSTEKKDLREQLAALQQTKGDYDNLASETKNELTQLGVNVGPPPPKLGFDDAGRLVSADGYTASQLANNNDQLQNQAGGLGDDIAKLQAQIFASRNTPEKRI